MARPAATRGVIDVHLSRPTDWAAVGALWREREAAFACSFFQSWTWMGCLAERRFPDPVLLQAFDGGRPVGLALFNRRGLTLYLGETGEPTADSLTIEHNGILMPPDAPAGTVHACLRAARRSASSVVLSGTDQAHADTAATLGPVGYTRTLPAPYVDLASIRASGRAYIDALSANTRYQLRRSQRLYTREGPLAAARAQTADEAAAFLEALIDLHQARWMADGKPGAFASPFVRDFHAALVGHGMERGEIDLWRVSAGSRAIGYLYNFSFRGRVLAYQSGLASDGDGQRKPGLTCHQLVIEAALANGAETYDFLAGDHRYKRNLATYDAPMHWTTCVRTGHPAWIDWQLRSLWRQFHTALQNVS